MSADDIGLRRAKCVPVCSLATDTCLLRRVPLFSSIMFVETFQVAPLGCNCTIVADLEAKQALVVDPGGDFDAIRARLAKHGLSVRAIVHTHTHFDHVGATADLQRLSNAPARIHEADLTLYNLLPVQAEMFGCRAPVAAELDTFLVDDEVISAGSISLRVLHTPGHSPGSCCFQVWDPTASPILFAGDTLFRRSIGRTDLWGGDHGTILRSIQGKLFSLPEDMKVVCGHGADTTIGYEKRLNPYLR